MPLTLLGFLLFHWQLLLRLLCSLFLFRPALKYCDPQDYVLGALFSLSHHPGKFTCAHLFHWLQLPFLCWWLPRSSWPYFFPEYPLYSSIYLLNISVWMMGMSFSMSPFATTNLLLLLCPISSQWKPLPSIQLPWPANILNVFLLLYSTCRELPSLFSTISFSIPVDTTSV